MLASRETDNNDGQRDRAVSVHGITLFDHRVARGSRVNHAALDLEPDIKSNRQGTG
jgi:hypothetical protein